MSNPDEAIRLFALSEAMRFAHLPVAGGLYDQHPKLVDKWEYLFHEKNKWERERAKKQEQTMKRKGKR